MLEPVGPSAMSSEVDPGGAQRVDVGKRGLPHMNLGASAWAVTGPLRPVVLNEAERRFKFRGLPQAVGAARRALREWEDHFEPELFYDLSLCVSEMVTKSVQHAEPPSVDEIELAVLRHDELVRVEVMERRQDVIVSKSAVMESSDWGMFIVDRVADRWGVDRSVGTRLWCEIDLAEDRRSRHGRARARLAVTSL